MKKFLFLIVLSIISLMLMGQSADMSNYEKYLLAQEQGIDQDTVKKSADTLKTEVDDLYYNPSTDKKQVTTIFNAKKGPKSVQPEEKLYSEEYEDGFVDGYTYANYDDPFYYSTMISRFHFGFGFGYYSPYWNFGWGYPYYGYGWYDPFYYDWYYPYYGYGWGYPYYGYGWGYPYYPYYGGGYYGRSPNYGHGMLGQKYYGYHETSTKTVGISSYNRASNMTNTKRISSGTQSKSVSSAQIKRNESYTTIKTENPSQLRRTSAIRNNIQNKVSTSVKSYTPNYSNPKMSTKPLYNNTRTNNMRSGGQERYIPSRTTTQSKNSYSAPNRNYNSSRTYSSPNKSSSSGYSAPRSTGSYSGGSSYRGGSSSYGGGSSGLSRGSSGGNSGSSGGRSSGGRR